jgi:acetyl esterase/lipase
MKRHLLSIVIVLAIAASAAAQTAPDAQSIVALWQKVRTVPNVTYVRANGWEGKLDVYALRGQTPSPVVIYIHGGGWVQGTKEGSLLSALPFLSMGYSVVNVEYRLANVSLAPAAIEDCRCALRWVITHGKEQQYNFDATRIVIAGASAGGHLALTTGMLPASAGFDRMCYTVDEPKVSAIVNFFGIADLPDMLEGPNKKPFPENWPYTTQWIGNQPNRGEIAKAASPMTYVRSGIPPTISIHGDADPLVPYQHSVRLQEALQKAGVPHELVTIPGGGHGNFTTEQWQRAYAAIEKFLATNVPKAKATSSAGQR